MRAALFSDFSIYTFADGKALREQKFSEERRKRFRFKTAGIPDITFPAPKGRGVLTVYGLRASAVRRARGMRHMRNVPVNLLPIA